MKQKVLEYLSITFVISWSCWLLLAFLIRFAGVALFSPIGLPLYSLGTAAPLIGAWIVKRKSGEGTAFLKQIIALKQPVTGYLLVIIFAWGFCFLPILLGDNEQQAPFYTALFQLPIMIFFGGGLEEPGWRGYLLPLLQKKYSSFQATCILAIIWTSWHLPLWLVKGSGQDTTSLAGFTICVFSLAFLLTILWNRYESPALCILLHAGINAFGDVYPPSFNQLSSSIVLLLICLLLFLGDHYLKQRS
ncbi:CAAX amino protease [Enterococcus florum]|uniref:CAAX amino protease n=1 Tax=Enterococcus florum TaxID=2480627 RepID=A0A4P5P9C9_9ENTE|nr:CPBP family intramembrane glutamic endopeptidase [Enterococcus florum]GCF94166.1 CAAX amino protease [Enterococcus florum]